jgi:hypothetical protein
MLVTVGWPVVGWRRYRNCYQGRDEGLLEVVRRLGCDLREIVSRGTLEWYCEMRTA